MRAGRAGFLVLAISWAAHPFGIRAQELKPETMHDFECYIQSAEKRMEERKQFLLAEANTALKQQVTRAKSRRCWPTAPIRTSSGAHLYDWIGDRLHPGATLDRTVRMLQDYDHRPQYFPESRSPVPNCCAAPARTISASPCGLKEPAVIDVESDVVWEQVDAHRWRCRSYSTRDRTRSARTTEYLQRLYSYWRFAETEKGVFVEGGNASR